MTRLRAPHRAGPTPARCGMLGSVGGRRNGYRRDRTRRPRAAPGRAVCGGAAWGRGRAGGLLRRCPRGGADDRTDAPRSAAVRAAATLAPPDAAIAVDTRGRFVEVTVRATLQPLPGPFAAAVGVPVMVSAVALREADGPRAGAERPTGRWAARVEHRAGGHAHGGGARRGDRRRLVGRRGRCSAPRRNWSRPRGAGCRARRCPWPGAVRRGASGGSPPRGRRRRLWRLQGAVRVTVAVPVRVEVMGRWPVTVRREAWAGPVSPGTGQAAW